MFLLFPRPRIIYRIRRVGLRRPAWLRHRALPEVIRVEQQVILHLAQLLATTIIARSSARQQLHTPQQEHHPLRPIPPPLPRLRNHRSNPQLRPLELAARLHLSSPQLERLLLEPLPHQVHHSNLEELDESRTLQPPNLSLLTLQFPLPLRLQPSLALLHRTLFALKPFRVPLLLVRFPPRPRLQMLLSDLTNRPLHTLRPALTLHLLRRLLEQTELHRRDRFHPRQHPPQLEERANPHHRLRLRLSLLDLVERRNVQIRTRRRSGKQLQRKLRLSKLLRRRRRNRRKQKVRLRNRG